MTDHKVSEILDEAKLFEIATLLAPSAVVPQKTIYERLCAGWPTDLASNTADPPPCRGQRQIIRFDGRVNSVTGWAKELNMPPSTLAARLDKGWSKEKALTTVFVPRKESARRATNNRARKLSNTPKPMIGRRFGRLLVAEEAAPDSHYNRQWLCHCDCGTAVTVGGCNLRSSGTQSCGCLRQEQIRKRQAQEIEQLEQQISTLQWSEDPHDKKLLRGLIVRLRKWRAKVNLFE